MSLNRRHLGKYQERLIYNYRKINKGTEMKSQSEKVHLRLWIKVEKISVDLEESLLHLNGKVCEENQWVRMGAYHSLDIVPSIEKIRIRKEEWDDFSIERLGLSLKGNREPVVVGCIFEMGVGHICYVNESTFILKKKFKASVPKGIGREKAKEKFFKNMIEWIEKTYQDFETQPPLLIASPGPYQQEMRKMMRLETTILLEHASSGYLNALEDILQNSKILKEKLHDLKFTQDMDQLQNFLNVFRKDPNRAYYSWSHIRRLPRGCIDKLILSFSFVRRMTNIEERKEFDEWMKRVKNRKTTVIWISTFGEALERLESFGGIAAILTYPISEDEVIDTE